jgi:hypothetical protein
MDRMINKLTERLAGASSRRGFLRTLGKITAGGAGAVAALATGMGLASATPLCCPGGKTCSGSTCPANTGVGNISYCCTAHDCVTHVTVCNDCYFVWAGDRFYVCTYTTIGSGVCAC